MHVFYLPEFLVIWYQIAVRILVGVCLIIFNSLFVNNCHLVKIIEGQVQVLTGLRLHLLSFQVVLVRYLVYFNATLFAIAKIFGISALRIEI